MNLYFDTEFTGLHARTTLISIGIEAENGVTFYAELRDYDPMQIDDWLRRNVINKLEFEQPYLQKTSKPGVEGMRLTDNVWEATRHGETQCGDKVFESFSLKMRGCTADVKTSLELWLKQFGEEQLVMWSDCLSYDWVLFNNIFGHAFNIPKNIYYIPMDICTLFFACGVDPDISRETFVDVQCEDKHNAMWDAHVIKLCKQKLDIILHGLKTIN